MSQKLTEQNFHYGQLIEPKNFNEIQQLITNNIEFMTANLLGFGIIRGFEVTFNEINKQINITGGLAFSEHGDLLSMDRTIGIDVIDHVDKPNYLMILGIKKALEGSDYIVEDSINSIPRKNTPIVEYSLTTTLTEGFIELAQIRFNPTFDEKCVISNSIKPFTPLQALDFPSMIEKVSTDVKNSIYPVGTTYTQYPDPTTGLFNDAKNPNALFGFGTWEMRFNDRGMFFRTEGGTAGEARKSSNGTQPHAIQQHQHSVDINHSHSLHRGFSWQHWQFLAGGSRRWHLSDGGDRTTHEGGSRSVSHPWGANTSGETRPVNMLMRIWERTA